ncbi:hypothetical protein HJG60_011597 [Phyllostomus discolor]|uniref:Uncharacterized protein n=1 Tax=Phyllostomus discolor TaxID=89673 RepID=A0A833ZW39_9CHIR|nr:hypothetical protein HJG60_011597 [Phyllostomus discolor]
MGAMGGRTEGSRAQGTFSLSAPAGRGLLTVVSGFPTGVRQSVSSQEHPDRPFTKPMITEPCFRWGKRTTLFSGRWVNVESAQAFVTAAGACWAALEGAQIPTRSCPNGKAALVAEPVCPPAGRPLSPASHVVCPFPCGTDGHGAVPSGGRLGGSVGSGAV